MLLEYFKKYIKVTRNVADSTVNHYITAINTINSILEKYSFPIKNVFDSLDLSELEAIKQFLKSNEEFVTKDTVGNRMYSVAFNHFYRFACEDHGFYEKNLDKLDIVIPKIITSSVTSIQRNRILKIHSIENAKYCCENDYEHITFKSNSTGKPYMEGHHLIPMKFQPEFDVSLDVYANIISLCPTCHRLLHYGTTKDRLYVADKLYEQRTGRLKNSGIDVSRSEFESLVV